jgi:very-short-patch-repair endonuclease
MLSDDQVKTVNAKVDRWVKRLLDFSGRNRLLIFKPTRTTTLEIVAPTDHDLFERIVVKGQTLTFPKSDLLSVLNSSDAADSFDQADQTATFSDRSTPLAVRCQPKHLSQILYNLNLKSRTAREEQGINILYLAFGFLTWRDSQKGELCKSPLVLVPVELTREAIGQPYQLTMLEDDLVLNPTLQEALRQFYAIQLPNIDNDLDAAGLVKLIDDVRACVASQAGWYAETGVVLDVFTYQKQMMVVDLKDHDQQIKSNPLILSISLPGFVLPTSGEEPILAQEMDDKITPEMTYQILDADSSQQEAIQAAKKGISFVLQGPPGTGKSQTISNIIAEFLADGKKVLFVSAKMAALEVVQDRLKKASLGDLCLQIHSHKRNKREVIDELRQSLEARPPETSSHVQAKNQNLLKIRGHLNDYVRALHRPQFTQQLSAFQLYGKLDKLRDAPEMRFLIPATQIDFSAFEEQRLRIQQMVTFTHVIQDYQNHPWYGCTINESSLQKRSEIQALLNGICEDIDGLSSVIQDLSRQYRLPEGPQTPQKIRSFLGFSTNYLPAMMAVPAGEILARYKSNYTGFTRFFRPQFWRDRKQIQQVTRTGDLPKTPQLLADLTTAQNLQAKLITENAQILTADNGQSLLEKGRPLSERIQSKLSQLSGFFHPTERPGNLKAMDDQNLVLLKSACQDLISHLSELPEWVVFQNHYREAMRLGIGPVIQEALASRLAGDHWEKGFEKRFYLLYLDEILNGEPALAQFKGEAHQKMIDQFRELDHELIANARVRIREKVLSTRPQAGWMNAPSSEEAILRREINKKRRIKPLRVLFSEIPGLILRLRPCLMMSPLTVSQLVDPEKFKFDLVVFDEASQIHPEEAIGAILRGSQVIVVGDRHQLPPTSFFDTIGAEDDSDEENFDEDLESVLNECDAAGMPNKMLAWHYRSRDESLIAFSNHHFYGDRLLTFPSAQAGLNGTGVSFVPTPEGIYQRGGRRNPVEAKKVVEMVIEHFQTTPNRSLGVVTFSQAQRDTIQIELDQALRGQPDLQRCVSESADEPFFVKNLELVQGDERDVMIFSIGYARDEVGKFILNFGPLNKDGGERRLNVAVTRARYAVKLVSSIQPEDIDVTRTASKGVHLLRSYLLLARDGIKALYADLHVSDDADFDSPFEQQVYEALSAKGLMLKKQVGVSGYRVDIAVVDPQQSGNFTLGIECDGAAYHRSFTARDRDRLRQEVLENLGWRIHRIWSRDWFENPAQEVAKVMKALDEAKQKPGPVSEKKVPAQVDPHPLNGLPPVTFQTTSTPAELIPQTPMDLPQGAVYYQIAKLTPRFTGAQGLNGASGSAVAELIKAVVQIEGPVHIDQVKTRIAHACGISRVGSRIETSITHGIGNGLRANLFLQRGMFLWMYPAQVPLIRVPKNNEDRRALEYICPEEVALVIDLCLRSAHSLTADDLVRETARLFKLQANDANSIAIKKVISQMERLQMVELRGEKYYPSVKYQNQPLPILSVSEWGS